MVARLTGVQTKAVAKLPMYEGVTDTIRAASADRSRAQPEIQGSDILEIEDVHVSFGGVHALSGVGFQVRYGEKFSVIGPNGAGKTSMLNVISGVYPVDRGRIVFDGRDCTRAGPQSLARLGIARTFQNVALFKGMSVLDNILVGRHVHMKSGLIACGLSWGPWRGEEREQRREAERITEFLEIEDIRGAPADTLPYGLQKRVELGRALALNPKLLLLDEPMAGMNQKEKREMVRYINEVNRAFSTTMILIEHDMGVIMDISDWVLVLDHGEKIAEGTTDQVRTDPVVIKAYLGEDVGD